MLAKRLMVLGAPVLVAGLIGACSSSGGSHNTSSSGPATSASQSATGGSQPTGAPIKIGTIGTFSGPGATTEAGAKPTMQAWVQWINAHGGIAGRPVQLFAEDDKLNASSSVLAVKKLIQQDKVVAIVGDFSNTDAAWANFAEQQGIPVIGGQVLHTDFFTNPDFFTTGANLAAIYYGLTSLAKQAGPKFAVLYCAESPVCASAVPLLKGFGTSQGESIAYSSSVSASAPDYTAVCQALKSSGVQSYYVDDQVDVAVRITEACSQQGVTAKVITVDGTMGPSSARSKAWDGAESYQQVFPFVDDSIQATKDFQNALKQYAPSVPSSDEMGSYPVTAWESGQLFAAAVKASNSSDVTSQSVLNGLYALHGETLGGMVMPLTFTKGTPTLINCFYRMDIKGGKIVEPDGLKTTCAPDAVVSQAIASLTKK